MNKDKEQLHQFLTNVQRGTAGSKQRIKKIAKSYLNVREFYDEYETITIDGKNYDIHNMLCCCIYDNI